MVPDSKSIEALFANAPKSKTDQERIDAVLQTPFFMNTLDINPESTDIIAALTALQMEGPPEEVAANFKNQGNQCFNDGNFKDAILYYTKGILVSCSDQHLLSLLFSNRAAVHLCLCNILLIFSKLSQCIKRLFVCDNS
jgi:hypothetical protein